MTSGMDYEKQYRQAEKSYIQGDYEEAATIIHRLAEEFSQDPSVLLLRGHIYCCFEQYDLAQQQYELVLQVSDEQDFLQCAHNALEQLHQFQTQGEVAEEEMATPEELDAEEQEWKSSVRERSPDPFDPNPFAAPQEDGNDSTEPIHSAASPESPTDSEAYPPNPSADSDPDAEQEEIDWNASQDDEEVKLIYSQAENEKQAFDTRESETPTENEELPDEEYDAETLLMQSSELEETFEETFGKRAQSEGDHSHSDFDITEVNVTSPSQQFPGLESDSDYPSAEEPENEAEEPEEEEGSDSLTSSSEIEPIVEVEQGRLAGFKNASLRKKNWFVAGAAGVVSAIAVAAGSLTLNPKAEGSQGIVPDLGKAGALMAISGVASFGTSWFLGRIQTKQTEDATKNLQAQLEAIQSGNFDAKATIYSKDELGQLAARFNQTTLVLSTTMNEAQRKASEQEQAKEDLQRQVIRLLDDVEGAAGGDLTVQAEVSADILGAVADAFNLTIRNLRTIVKQVKEAAHQVNESSTESESFARGLSSEALRQAEELAVTLNSVQTMTNSIQRVAGNAQKAEEVARSASETALKGGEAVDSTMAGILQIRETVAQTTRKVKRLAESSQEISKIVAAISQISSRTNRLALNASIEAARAGESGRGFAIVADEVRQLADRSVKSLTEIEEIVSQIQSETSSVMSAMEEGTQQVIEGTERAEQAKRSLEEIIEVSSHIDTLVSSITADTVEQTKTSSSVTEVMQSVERTAQGTSQESQKVSGSLQNLVSLAGELLSSVERFRVEPAENKKS